MYKLKDEFNDLAKLKDEFDELDKLNCKFDVLDKFKDEFDELDKLNCKFDELDKLNCKFDELDKLKDEFDEFDKLKCKFDELDKLKDEFDELDKLNCKFDELDKLKDDFDELDKLYCKFDELDKLSCKYKSAMLDRQSLVRVEDPVFPTAFPSNDFLERIYIEDFFTKESIYHERMTRLNAESILCNHTFKVAANIGFKNPTNGTWVKMYDSVFCILNENGQVVKWCFKGTSFDKVTTLFFRT